MSDDLIKRLRDEHLPMTRNEVADRIEQLERENQQLTNTLGVMNTAWDQALDQRNKAEAKLAKAVNRLTDMRDNQTGYRHVVHFRRGASVTLAELEGKE
jgi:hypothetical protein